MTRQLARMGFDIAAPIIVYYVLRSAGASYLIALSAAAVPPALSALYTLITRRQADSVALLMLTTIVAGLLTSLIAASPRFLLAKDGVFTGVWGIWFIASARTERPAAFIFARPFMEGMKWFASRPWDVLWETEPRFRTIWRVSSVIWGSGLLIDAAVRVVIAYTLPVDAVPGLGGALFPITFDVLQLVTNVYYNLAGLYPILGARWTTRRAYSGELA
jgi:hypothetical protein